MDFRQKITVQFPDSSDFKHCQKSELKIWFSDTFQTVSEIRTFGSYVFKILSEIQTRESSDLRQLGFQEFEFQTFTVSEIGIKVS